MFTSSCLTPFVSYWYINNIFYKLNRIYKYKINHVQGNYFIEIFKLIEDYITDHYLIIRYQKKNSLKLNI